MTASWRHSVHSAACIGSCWPFMIHSQDHQRTFMTDYILESGSSQFKPKYDDYLFYFRLNAV